LAGISSLIVENYVRVLSSKFFGNVLASN